METAFTRDQYASAQGDKYDCSVRSMSVAAGITYDEASALFREEGRLPNRGTSVACTERVLRRLGRSGVRLYPPRLSVPLAQMLLFGYFAKGSFVAHTAHHALAIVDGVVHNWNASGRIRIVRYYQL